MNDLSLPRRFLKVSRNFGLAVAVKVTYSKIRGVLYPALALPDGRVYDHPPRQVSFLIDTAEHDAATVNAVVDVIGAHDAGTWEICICERPAVAPEMARLLERLRGTQPWIRIVQGQILLSSWHDGGPMRSSSRPLANLSRSSHRTTRSGASGDPLWASRPDASRSRTRCRSPHRNGRWAGKIIIACRRRRLPVGDAAQVRVFGEPA